MHVRGCCSCDRGTPVQIGNNLVSTEFNVPCGTESQPLFESFLECPPTVTVATFTSTAEEQCDATLVIEQTDGTILEFEIIWSDYRSDTSIIVTVEDVANIRVRCEGDGLANCQGALNFFISYC
ncbi:hypothetical protein SM124_13225 [Bacillus sp. 31A1R]|uniref:Uncharacterized protein n=1 Tax=Robertmurraya mangrovi TaxID=3098077 RepID=A0ABU5IZU8_9BACI|nr:hypothetical protein [Bacillus sp. 31A1R]MDZ5472694.1 hypothetical protein [Bacillus sp. 31A1R]